MAKDIVMNPDLEIADGDFVLQESENQDIQFILDAHQGEFRQWPLVGFGIEDWLLAPFDLAKFRKGVSLQLRIDGFTQHEVLYQDGELIVSGQR